MKTKLHYKTQRALNAYAKKYLQLYRNSRNAGKEEGKNDSPAVARWRAHFAMHIDITPRMDALTSARYIRYNAARRRNGLDA